MYDSSPDPSGAGYWIAREHYRKAFGLTATEADNEPLDEFYIMQNIWILQQKRQKLEEFRAQNRHG